MLHKAIRELYKNVVVIYGDTVEDVIAKDSDMKEVSLVADDINAKIKRPLTECDNKFFSREIADV